MKYRYSIACICGSSLLIEMIKIIFADEFKCQFYLSVIYTESKIATLWLSENQRADLPVYIAKNIDDFYHEIITNKVDYLFSIQNSYIIPDDVISCINTLSINFHNSILPKYPSHINNIFWMLWDNEEYSPVTWRVMAHSMLKYLNMFASAIPGCIDIGKTEIVFILALPKPHLKIASLDHLKILLVKLIMIYGQNSLIA